MPFVANAPTALTRDEDNTNSSQVVFNWSAPSDTGGTPIDDYTILILVGSQYIIEADHITNLYYTKSDVTAGLTYTFVVEARNDVGLGALSSLFEIIAASRPSNP